MAASDNVEEDLIDAKTYLQWAMDRPPAERTAADCIAMAQVKATMALARAIDRTAP